jgi:putative oxidoreductase
MANLGLLILRLAVGALVAGHGAQKLFGWFGGRGLKGTSDFLESLGLRPSRLWALLASGSEFGGGVLTLLGLLNPLGPISTIGAMSMATAKAHWGKPIWATKGGAELPVTNMTASLAIGLMGPGKFSLDRLLGLRPPRGPLLAVGLAMVAATVAVGVMRSSQPQPQAQEQKQEAKQAQPEKQPQAEKAEKPRQPAVPAPARAPERTREEEQEAPEMVPSAELHPKQEGADPS